MKTSCYDRDWAVTVLDIGSNGEASLGAICREMFSRKVSWKSKGGESGLLAGAYRSRTKYFAGDLSEYEAPAAENDIRELASGRQTSFEYPLYAGRTAVNRPVVFLAVPYVSLSREIWTEALTSRFLKQEYLAPKIGAVFRAIARRKVSNLEEALSQKGFLTVLRSGRVNITTDPNLHGLVMVGNNVMQSDFYRNLKPSIDEQSGTAWLSRTAAKFGFWSESRRRIVIRMDRFGNYRLRPGRRGERLHEFTAFLSYLHTIQAVDWRSDFPGSRAVDLTSDETL